MKYDIFVDSDRTFLGIERDWIEPYGRVYQRLNGRWVETNMTYPSCLKFMPYAEITGAGEVNQLADLGIKEQPVAR